MTINFKPSGGVHGDGLQTLASSWDIPTFTNKLPMYFYRGDARDVIDVKRTVTGFTVTLYPWNPANSKEIIEGLTETFLEEAYQSVGLDEFSYDVKTKSGIQPYDFCMLSGNWKDETHASFVFGSTDNPNLAFPHMFVVSLGSSPTDYKKDVLNVQAMTSHEAATPATFSTHSGKEFTFMLINSFRNDVFVGSTPHLNSVAFPTNPNKDNIPDSILTEDFQKFCDGLEVDKLLAKNVAEKKNEIVPVQKPDNPAVGRLTALARGRVARGMLEHNTILMSDVIQYGLTEILQLIPASIQKDGLKVDIDMEGTEIKDAYILDDILYFTPDKAGFEWDSKMGGGSAFAVECHEDVMELLKKGDAHGLAA